MTDPTLVFVQERERRSELVVNFGVFSGREATEAEIYRLAQALLGEVDGLEIVSEQRYEFEVDMEATVHQVRVLLPSSAGDREQQLLPIVEEWARDAIGERRVITP
jgi:hypothetical protein